LLRARIQDIVHRMRVSLRKVDRAGHCATWVLREVMPMAATDHGLICLISKKAAQSLCGEADQMLGRRIP
jgi:hypothetical protein